MDIKSLDKEYVANTYARIPLTLVRGQGATAWDDEGKAYIDLGSGIAVNTFGFADEELSKAVTRQMGTLQHTSNYYYTEPSASLAELLCTRTGMRKVFFGNSGAEANECAIKTARKWAFEQYGDENHSTIITLEESFHGRTITTLAATGQEKFHKDFGPFTPGFVYARPGDAAHLAALAAKNACCAVMVEIIQGEGGVNVLPEAYLKAVTEIAAEYNLLLIIDEVQTGNGRTGKLYSYMHYGLTPDIVTTAKGLAGGLPMGACLLGARVENVLGPGSHGSTFGGNPLCCAAALSVMNRLDEALLASVGEKGRFLMEGLRGAPGVTDVSGMGLMIGISTVKPVGEVLTACREKGILALTAHEKLRLLPPLNISQGELDEALKILLEVLRP